jgi:hypothetical protein
MVPRECWLGSSLQKIASEKYTTCGSDNIRSNRSEKMQKKKTNMCWKFGELPIFSVHSWQE